MAQPSITHCIPQHYDAVADIYNESVQKGFATMDDHLFTAEDIESWVNRFNERERLFVLLQEDTVIGWSIIKKYHDRPGYRTTCETAVYLTESETAKGYGPMMKKHLISICKELGYHHLVAKIWAENKISINYNLKLGYEIVGTQKEVGFKNGRWIDVTIMQYIIR